MVDEFGLRPPGGLTIDEVPLTTDDLGVVCTPDEHTLSVDRVLAAAGEDKGEPDASKNGCPPVRPWLRVLPHPPCAVGELLPTEQVIAERRATSGPVAELDVRSDQ